MPNKIYAFLLTRIMNVYCLSLGILSFSWGLILTIGQTANSNLSDFMTFFAPEPVWGSAAMLAGLLMGYGAIKGCEKSSKLGLFCGFLVWGFVFLTNAITIPWTTGVASSAFIVWCHVMGHLVISSRPEVLKEHA